MLDFHIFPMPASCLGGDGWRFQLDIPPGAVQLQSLRVFPAPGGWMVAEPSLMFVGYWGYSW